MAKSNTKLRDQWWPEIGDVATARKVARQAFWVAVVITGITVVFGTLAAFGKPLAGMTPFVFIDAALFGVVALGIWHMSRTAAVAGLVVFGLEKLVMARNVSQRGNIIIAIIFLIAFANGVRATFAYHKLRGEQVAKDEMPVAPQ